jgi:plasmid replication initiation protein
MAKDGNAGPPDLFSIAARFEPKVPVFGGQQPAMNIARHQLDLFVAFIGDVPLRDDREGMSVPLVSLSKGKRIAPIEWRSPDGERFVNVTANATHGMATIWDMDVLIWAVSQINEAINTGREVSPVLRFHPHDMLKAIGRDVGGDHYAALEEALRRLAGTLVETNIRSAIKRRREMFHLIEHWAHDTDPVTGRSKGMMLTLPGWIYDGVVQHRDVLAISPRYFDLTSGIARWLYRLARRHAGKQPAGWRFTMKVLHARSGSTQPLSQFAKDVRRVVAGQGVPEYRLDIIQGQRGDETVAMVRDPTKTELPQRRDLARIVVSPAACSGDEHGGSPPARHGGSPPKTRRITTRKRPQPSDFKR